MTNTAVHPTNEQLMQDFYSGRTEALGMLADCLRARLEAFAYSRLPERLPARRQRAEDLVQDAFVKVWKTFDQPNRWRVGCANVNTWLHIIVRNLVASSLRGQRWEQPMSDMGRESDGGAEEPAENRLVDGRWARQAVDQERDEQALAVLAAIHKLSNERRQIIEMYYFDRQTFKQMAHRLGVVPSTVMRWHSAAVAELQHIMVA